MKKIDKLILMDFIPPYLMAFLVAEFVLVMQFLWKYIDEIVGKGISLGVLLELIFYFAVRIIPEAVPVTILISSVMVFGNLAEKYELSSMKSAGISLTRVMMAGVLLAMMTGLFSLVASNYLKPRANYKFFKRFLAVRKQDPSLNIEEGVFAYDFKNFTIKIGEKDKDGEGINDILIYDNSSPDKQKINMLVAETGRMYVPDGSENFIMDLNEGEQYRELSTAKTSDKKYPFVRTKFKSWSKVFDMSDFDFEAQSLNQSRKKYDLLNARQLKQNIDSFQMQQAEKISTVRYNYSDILDFEEYVAEDKIKENEDQKLPAKVSNAILSKEKQEKANKPKQKKKPARKQIEDADISEATSLLGLFQASDAKSISKSMKYLGNKKMDALKKTSREHKVAGNSKNRYILRLNQMFSWALICVVFLFIGAPLGSIVKKGGYGYPLLIAIFFFMLFIIMNIMGEKLCNSGQLSPVLAAWFPNIILIPVAIIITYKALTDSNFNGIQRLFQKLMLIIQKKH